MHNARASIISFESLVPIAFRLLKNFDHFVWKNMSLIESVARIVRFAFYLCCPLNKNWFSICIFYNISILIALSDWVDPLAFTHTSR
jgi:hypothetical protein